ncbi:MAG: hypothetical protein IJE81_03930 [Oscillospiraceae bacterium]|nr:hypothetical protein [Oscillospiraceae bacterium]MBQ7129534.1 hypothetical protein [Oscillospiraceae bacterium]
MGKLAEMTAGWKKVNADLQEGIQSEGSVYSRIKRVIGILVMCVYRLRSVFLAIPVAYYALKLAAYNGKHLPEQVGLNLLSNGEFAVMISRELAVTAPLAVTAACLVLMFTSRKALYPWAVSIFTLILPVLLLISNLYPA